MLSHHELATLLRLADTERRPEAIDPDVLALSRYDLIEIDRREEGVIVGGTSTLRLTSRGRELVRRLFGGGDRDGA
ncbi:MULTISPECIES: hypothetical protein [Paraburkholderia]|jgi:hypothetical protein|uniref:Preprotein translocase subunit SecA n=1 Tax=Paraburkholderia dipogonis TaxID=1211383 RepID=A0ABW9AP90_9BURK|nr:hypothetical protein [Paraburkholderia sp. BL9I2N2]TCK87538.1 hypothetical protein B0G74_8085 [Paraburkholderia sp. BL9I2N2]